MEVVIKGLPISLKLKRFYPAFPQKAGESPEARSLWSPVATGEILLSVSERRRVAKISPVDCFGVGDPRRGSPICRATSEAKRSRS